MAELANGSIGTVDRALHGRGGIKESTRQQILQIARQIGYTPNLAARIGVCMPREIHSSSMTSCGAVSSMKLAAWPS
jgi:LacI family transcriptional regulator